MQASSSKTHPRRRPDPGQAAHVTKLTPVDRPGQPRRLEQVHRVIHQAIIGRELSRKAINPLPLLAHKPFDTHQRVLSAFAPVGRR